MNNMQNKSDNNFLEGLPKGVANTVVICTSIIGVLVSAANLCDKAKEAAPVVKKTAIEIAGLFGYRDRLPESTELYDENDIDEASAD